MSVEELSRAALGLEPKERADLAAELLASLDEAEEHDADAVEAGWQGEAARRLGEVLEGRIEGATFADVREQVRKRLDELR